MTKKAVNNVVYSVVVPCFNEELVLQDLYKRIKLVMDSTKEAWELLLVNDGSVDNSLSIMRSLHDKDSRVHYVNFSRNFGAQAAITAGLEHASGKAIIVIDADLQDPPEVILDLIVKWREGFEVVYAVRSEREGESAFKKITATIFYRFINSITSMKIPMDTGEFRLMDRKVINAIKSMHEKNRFMRGITSWVGFRQTGVYYKRVARLAGESHYSVKKMVKLALDAITSFSYKPIEVFSTLGIILLILGVLSVFSMIVFSILGYQISFNIILITVIATIAGIQLFSIGSLGEYIGRIYDEVRNRPLYIVDEFV